MEKYTISLVDSYEPVTKIIHNIEIEIGENAYEFRVIETQRDLYDVDWTFEDPLEIEEILLELEMSEDSLMNEVVDIIVN